MKVKYVGKVTFVSNGVEYEPNGEYTVDAKFAEKFIKIFEAVVAKPKPKPKPKAEAPKIDEDK